MDELHLFHHHKLCTFRRETTRIKNPINILKTNAQHSDFRGLVALLDAYLAKIDGDEHTFYKNFNTIQELQHCLVLYENDLPVGCGAIKRYDTHSFEIKRMFIRPEARGKGFAQQLVTVLEDWAQTQGATHCLLETGKRMPDAIALYTKMGYTPIENYSPYIGVANSVCFIKKCS